MANRIYDMGSCTKLESFVREKKHRACTLTTLRELHENMKDAVANDAVRIGNPTGDAGAHSGLTWLRDVCS